MLFEMTEEEVKTLVNLVFEPQRAKEILDRCRLVSPKDIKLPCAHISVERVNLKVGSQSDDGWQSLQATFKCVDCGIVMEPSGYKPKVFAK